MFARVDPPKDTRRAAGEPEAGEGERAQGDEGTVGERDAERAEARGERATLRKHARDRQVAENAGVLGVDLGGSELDGVFSSTAVDRRLVGGIGGVAGAKGVQRGSGGVGSRGDSFGGGGTAEALGGLGTKGPGTGASGYGSEGGDFGDKQEGAFDGPQSDAIVVGPMDRSLIDEVVKRHMSQIRYCYQRELSRQPTLGGKVVVGFTIAKDGSVAVARVKSS